MSRLDWRLQIVIGAWLFGHLPFFLVIHPLSTAPNGVVTLGQALQLRIERQALRLVQGQLPAARQLRGSCRQLHGSCRLHQRRMDRHKLALQLLHLSRGQLVEKQAGRRTLRRETPGNLHKSRKGEEKERQKTAVLSRGTLMWRDAEWPWS